MATADRCAGKLRMGLTLSQGLHPDGLIVRKPMILRLHPGMIHERPGVGNQSAHCRANMTINLGNLFDARRF